MLGEQGLNRDFRLRGFTSQHMESPRVPIQASPVDERKRNEENLQKYFGKSSFFDPAKPRIDDSNRGMQYGSSDYDRGHPHPRPMRDPFNERSDAEVERFAREQRAMDEDIQMMKERQMRERVEREEEKKKTHEMLSKSFPWDRQNQGHGAPRDPPKNEYTVSKKKETDLFLDVLGGADGKQLRQNGSPGLTDLRFERQQQQFHPSSPGRANGMTPREMDDYSKKMDSVNEEIMMKKQQRRIEDLRKQIDQMKHEPGATDYGYDPGNYQLPPDNNQGFQNTQNRSLNLDKSRGGAGAPIMDNRGKAVTRRPITLMRNDYGDSKIKEDIPGKINFDLNFEDENKPYYPWGGPGAGAPIRDKDGNVRTQIYGKLEDRQNHYIGADANRGGSGEVRRSKRRQEVLYNELREGMRQQKENKEELNRYMKAPQNDLAEMMMAGRVGKPKRNEITGEIGHHHLGNSDVSLLKMNHQPRPVDEKKQYHDELRRAAEERQHLKRLEKLKEKQESNAHFNNMDNMWGMYGGGAPKDPSNRKKANLFNSIHNPEISPRRMPDPLVPQTGLGVFQRTPNVGYQKMYVNGDDRQFPSTDNTPRYVKTTTNSTHKNMFDAPDNSRNLVAPTGSGLAPYATGGLY